MNRRLELHSAGGSVVMKQSARSYESSSSQRLLYAMMSTSTLSRVLRNNDNVGQRVEDQSEDHIRTL